MRSDMIEEPDYWRVTTTEVSTLNSLDRVSPLFMLYDGIGYCRKSYGKFKAGDDGKEHCILKLESAFEDAVRMPRQDRGNDYRYRVILDRYERVTVQPIHEGRILHHKDNLCSVEVSAEEFLDGDTLLWEKVSAAARKTYEKFCQVAGNA